MAEVIQFVGVSDLKEPEQDVVTKLAEEYHEKYSRTVKDIQELKVHVKTSHDEGTKKLYEISVNMTLPGHSFNAKEQDWDLPRTMHKVLGDLEMQCKHEFHK